ncbi:OsmC family protein [Massilia sp. R2A-15]|uniref:OsmC family protein n=1 Tax=Massilia sp. R2A-15 TaxID=3064278 RepID=UPI002732B530|nr:OsmC family protein [Massilia sp. R2A-15]WLI90932.1 OsmC family protein [Massilia sp. R2A-15]
MSISVTRDLSQPLGHVVHVRDHQFVTDGSIEEGGTDSGPSPHDLYDAALASCKAMTLVWYAGRKGIPLRDVKVDVVRDASAERQGVYKLATVLHLGGDLTEAQRQELLTVAGKCPVHKLMTTVTTEITTALA